MDDISAVMKKQFPVTAPPPPKPSWLDQTVSGVKEFGQKHGRDIAGIAGSTVGGILAAPEAIAAGIPTIGLGGIVWAMPLALSFTTGLPEESRRFPSRL